MICSTNSHLSNLKQLLRKTTWENWHAKICAIEASHRVYWRLTSPKDASISRIAMVAPPKLEKLEPFIQVASLLESINLHPPHIYYQDTKAGLLILEDLGYNTYRQIILRERKKLPELYTLFNNVMLHLHGCFNSAPTSILNRYTEELLWSEIESLFLSWYIPHTKIPSLSDKAKQSLRSIHKDITKKALDIPHSLCLRDAIVDNFMYRPLDKDLRKCAILDFQDALWGPITYDFASMYHDARFYIPSTLTNNLIDSYLIKNPHLDKEKFTASFLVFSAQRNLKVLGTFSRLAYRDGKTKYLQYIPLAWHFIEKSLSHPSLSPLKEWINTHIPKNERKIPSKPFSSKKTIHQAMIMCAGFGNRLHPLTQKCPKPLLPISDTTALGWLIEKLREQGIEKIIINTHYLANQVENYIKNYDCGNIKFIFSHEDTILDTGGGIQKALPHFEGDPFFVLNCDTIWSGDSNPLESLSTKYNSNMLALLGLAQQNQFLDYTGTGDYILSSNNKPHRITKKSSEKQNNYIFTGIRILHPNLFKHLKMPPHPFSLLELFDFAEKNNKLYAQVYSNKLTWWDLGNIEKLKKAQAFFTPYSKEEDHE